ncbi:MAG: hypothetical protein ACLFVO_21990, partial [Chloroflexaceae bacterium]
ERLLTNPKIADVADLERLLNNPKIADVAELERLLTNPKIADVAELERLLTNPKIADVAELERLLTNPKLADVAELERLLTNPKIADVADLERLLTNPKIADVAELERLMGMVDNDIVMLEHALGILNNDVEMLERLADLAGGNPTRLQSLLVNVQITGTPDFPHEASQALLFGSLEGGGEFQFLGNSSQGIEGFFVPQGTTQMVPVSLKDFSRTGRMPNLIGRLNQNANQIRSAGYGGNVVLHADVPQFAASDLMNFVRRGPVQNMPNEGVFQRLVFTCQDGVVVVDSSGVYLY